MATDLVHFGNQIEKKDLFCRRYFVGLADGVVASWLLVTLVEDISW